jgi:hypothetical protein
VTLPTAPRLAAAKEYLGIPPVVAICGSTRFMAEMAEADLRETAAGRIVVKPGCDLKKPHPLWADPAEAEALKAKLDDLHRAKIRLADEVLVVGDYIGDSTRAEIAYARNLGKLVRFTHPQVDPDREAPTAAPHEIRTGGAPTAVQVLAVEPVPGLHVYEQPEDLRGPGDETTHPWRLGHHSGLPLAAFPSQDDALRAAYEVAAFADWTRDAEDLRADASFDLSGYYDRLMERTNGLLIARSTKEA